MKQYPSISHDIIYSNVWIQPKYDGQNFRAEWNNKKGFYKFGSRTQLVDKSSSFSEAIDLVISKYSESIKCVFDKNKWKDGILFFEYFGPNSFAGKHLESDIKDVVLFDVNPFKQGILMPDEFYDKFAQVKIVPCLYKGQLTRDIVNQIQNSKFNGMTFEGVVVKAIPDNNTKMPVMFKIKSNAWLEKLKQYCGDNKELYQKLL